MKWFNLASWFRGSKFANPGGDLGASVRATQPLGPWSGMLDQFVPHQVNPYLYEAMRRALAPLDGGIERLVTLDGIVGVEGDSDKLAAEVAEFIESVPVNDGQQSLQAFYAGQGNELYEQGYTVGEFVIGSDGRSIEGLRVADSKGIRFQRTDRGLDVYYLPPGCAPKGRQDGTDDAERIIRGTTSNATVDHNALTGAGYKKLNAANLVYAVRMPEADNPYGTSVMRSIEFVSQILLAIQNATDRVWQRFGDPPFQIKYKTANRKVTPDQLTRRQTELATNLASAMQGKRLGNSADFVNALGADDDIVIEVIGASAVALEIDMPARHMLEQVTAKLGLPSWMFGYSWTSSPGDTQAQVEMILQDAKTRWEQRRPALTRVIETMLRLRGRTWKRGDWKLVQRLPNLRDELKAAQAEFLRGQTVMMLGGHELPASPAEPGTDPNGGGQPKALHGPLTAAQIKAALESSSDAASLAAALAQHARA